MSCVGRSSGNITSKSTNQICCLLECPINVQQCAVRFLVSPFRSWIHRLRSAVFSVLQEDRSRGKGSTTFPMIRWVLPRMHDGGWTLLSNDTEPGFSFHPDSETRDIAISLLVPGSYTETHFDGVQIPGLMKAYCVIANGVGGLHGKRAQSAVFSSQWCEGATAISQIRLLCKMTKGSGKVTFRCVHSAVPSMWTGLSAWLAHHLRERIAKQLPHLSRNTKDFVDDLRLLHWQDDMRMVMMDVKEFYMSGEPGFLSRACSEICCDETGVSTAVCKSGGLALQTSICAVGVLA